MKILLITENPDIKEFFRDFENNGYPEIVILSSLDNFLKNENLPDFNIIIVDAKNKTDNIINYFNQAKISKFDLKKFFIILDNTSNTTEFTDIGLYNLLFKPLDEKTIKSDFLRIENDLKDFNSLIIDNKKKEKHQAKLEKTLQLMPDGVVIVDSNAIITYTNLQIEQLFGYKSEELIGKDIETLVPDQYREKHIGYRNKYISNPKIRPMGSQLDVSGIKKDGSIFPVDISLSPIRIEDDFFIVSTIKDITDKKQVKQELKDSRDAAEAANRAKSDFLANMSHELRTPLNAILGYSQILLRDRELTQKQNDEIKVIKASGEHLLGLINDILDLSKIEAGTMELNPVEFNLPDFINGIADLFKIRANEKGLSFHYEVLTSLPLYVNSDEKKLRQILFNLLSNALKFTEKGGIALKTGQKGNTVIFQVEDTGIGIESNKQNEIFQPFTQVSSQTFRAEGTGLGLSISQKLANILGSEIKIKSKTGEGSNFSFEVYLLAVKQQDVLPSVNENMITGYKGDRKKVLIADDKWENRSVLLNLLSPLDFIVFEAIDGLDCLTKCIKYRPDIIFLDLRMPNMGGFEVAEKIRQTEYIKNTIIVAVSASAFEVDKSSSIEAGCNEFIAKPFRQEKIFYALENNLGLEWIYQDISKEEINNLPAFTRELKGGLTFIQADKIKELSLMGDVTEIIKFLKEFEDTENTAVIQHIENLAKNFEFEEIINLLDGNT